ATGHTARRAASAAHPPSPTPAPGPAPPSHPARPARPPRPRPPPRPPLPPPPSRSSFPLAPRQRLQGTHVVHQVPAVVTPHLVPVDRHQATSHHLPVHDDGVDIAVGAARDRVVHERADAEVGPARCG